MTTYASVSDLIARRDKRFVAELVTDTPETMTDAELLANTNLATLLEDASGQVEAAMQCGDRYRPAALASLTGGSLAMLKKVVCTIAIADAFERRPGVHAETAARYRELSEKYLDDLRTGRNLFSLSDDSAVNAATAALTAPSVVDYTNLNLLPEQMIRHFPNRVGRLPLGR